MDLEIAPTWHPVDRRQFQIWLERQVPEAPMGMAGGYTLHPVALYLSHRDRGFWCLEICREEVRLLNRNEPGRCFYCQAGWLLDFCWELKRFDAHRNVTAIDCLRVLEQAPW